DVRGRVRDELGRTGEEGRDGGQLAGGRRGGGATEEIIPEGTAGGVGRTAQHVLVERDDESVRARRGAVDRLEFGGGRETEADPTHRRCGGRGAGVGPARVLFGQ